jgi:ATP-dependent helicase HrpB
MSWQNKTKTLPISEHLTAICEGISHHSISVLQAPPGSGKTTVLPLALAECPWLSSKKILVLQPRRVAARGVAAQMSRLLGEGIGERVGYQVRLDRRISEQTTVEVLTEGILSRRIISDPELRDVGLIIFDEFHERGINADLSFGLAHEVQGSLRPDLKLVIMSATMGSAARCPLFRGAWEYSFQAAPHTLSISYVHPEPRRPIWETVASSIVNALLDHPGDLLAFLPGRGEIERVHEHLSRRSLPVVIRELYGEQSLEEQQAAISPDSKGGRKVVLATPVAETSLTIEGVRIVVDSGLHKVARSTANGINSLTTERITVDAADQRAGRAARMASGVCIRLWSEYEHRTMRAEREPEVARVDLTPMALDLAAWGVTDPLTFSWITPPTAAQAQTARAALLEVGAVSADGSITDRGKQLATLGLHPRFGAMCLTARALNVTDLCAELLALFEERLPRRDSADITPLLGRRSRSSEVVAQWRRRLESLPQMGSAAPPRTPAECTAEYLLATAWPGRIARRREEGASRYLLATGEGVELSQGDPLKMKEFILVTHLQESTEPGRIFVHGALPLDAKLFDGALAHLLTTETVSSFSEASGTLSSLERLRCGALILKERAVSGTSSEARTAALLDYLSTESGFARLRFSAEISSLRERTTWLSPHMPTLGLPHLDDITLRSTLSEWLAPFLGQEPSLAALSSGRIDEAVRALLSWEQQQSLDREAPKALSLPNGRTRPLTYDPVTGPYAEVLLQDLFGLADTPTIGTRRTPITLHILSPARRPVQVTRDLGNFWRSTYAEVRKELRGRYPKHRWPDDPTQPVAEKKKS